jgi:hypothetical protein
MMSEWFDGKMFMVLHTEGSWMKIPELVKRTVDIEVQHALAFTRWAPLVRTICGMKIVRWMCAPTESRVHQAIGLHVMRATFEVREIPDIEWDPLRDPECATRPRIEVRVSESSQKRLDDVMRGFTPAGRRSRFQVVSTNKPPPTVH